MITILNRKKIIGLIILFFVILTFLFLYSNFKKKQLAVEDLGKAAEPNESILTERKIKNEQEVLKEVPSVAVNNDIGYLGNNLSNNLEKLVPQVAIVSPMQDFSLDKPIKKLNEKERKIAEGLLSGIAGYIENIDFLEFNLSVKDNYDPLVDMEGQITSNKIDTFSFKGTIIGQTINADIDCTKEMSVISMQGPEAPGKAKKTGYAMPGSNERLGSFELLQNIWMTPLRKLKSIDLFENVTENIKLKDTQGNELTCTVLSGPQFKWIFESSSGRLLRAESTHPDQKTITKLIYDKKNKYPKKIVISYPDGDDSSDDRTITIENKNLKIQYKNKEI